MDVGNIARDVAVRAKELKRQGQFPEAKSLLLEAFAILPTFHPARKQLYRGLGKILLALGDHDGAAFAFSCDFDASISADDPSQTFDSLFWLGIASVTQYTAHRSSNLLGKHTSFTHDKLESFSSYIRRYAEANRTSTYPSNIAGEVLAVGLDSLSPTLREALQAVKKSNDLSLTCYDMVIGIGSLSAGSIPIDSFVSVAEMESRLPGGFDLPFAIDSAERIPSKELRLPPLIIGMEEDSRLTQLVFGDDWTVTARPVWHNQVFQGQFHTSFGADEVIFRRHLTALQCSWLLETDCQGGAYRASWNIFAVHGPACFRVVQCDWDESELRLQFFASRDGRPFGGRLIDDDATVLVLSIPSARIHIIGPELKR